MNAKRLQADNVRAAVMACPHCHSSAKIIFLTLCNAADIEGLSAVDCSVVPFDTVCEHAKVRSRTSVLRSLQVLVDCGHVELLQIPTVVNYTTRTRNHYRVVMP